ncbi:ABC transporter, ATP-binding protein [Chitinispirillum alkaliphilum]|nr:ABC transporter, ATP-binding protein [Chitinispirillum alkaliphilum]
MDSSSDTQYAINIKGLHKSFGKLKVLEGVDFGVKRGEVVALLGPNGSGKTTIVRILSTLLKADRGDISVGGYDVVREGEKVRSVIGLTGQYAAVDEYLTARENLRMMGRLYHLNRKLTDSRTEQLLKQFDLMDAANRYVKTYSGGMRRRLDLAVSLIATPPILFLDEPTTALDPRSRVEMWNIVEELVRGGTTILLTTQHLEEADRLADRIIVINKGRVIAQGTADQLKRSVGTEKIHFTFAHINDLRKASMLIEKTEHTTDEKQKSLLVSNKQGIRMLKDLLQKFEHEQINVTGLACSKPTLDDVFIKLTGQKAAQEKNDNSNFHSQE